MSDQIISTFFIVELALQKKLYFAAVLEAISGGFEPSQYYTATVAQRPQILSVGTTYCDGFVNNRTNCRNMHKKKS
jgi:hypothetical protein